MNTGWTAWSRYMHNRNGADPPPGDSDSDDNIVIKKEDSETASLYLPPGHKALPPSSPAHPVQPSINDGGLSATPIKLERGCGGGGRDGGVGGGGGGRLGFSKENYEGPPARAGSSRGAESMMNSPRPPPVGLGGGGGGGVVEAIGNAGFESPAHVRGLPPPSQVRDPKP